MFTKYENLTNNEYENLIRVTRRKINNVTNEAEEKELQDLIDFCKWKIEGGRIRIHEVEIYIKKTDRTPQKIEQRQEFIPCNTFEEYMVCDYSDVYEKEYKINK